MIQNCLYIMLGGAVGALMRYGIGQLCQSVRLWGLPVGTLAANLLGCLLLGILTAVAEHHTCIPRPVVLMLTVGVCGAFTTFSTFSSETIRMMEGGHVLMAMGYVAASVCVGFLLFWVGKHCA